MTATGAKDARVSEQLLQASGTRTLRMLCDVATEASFGRSVEEVLGFALARVCSHAGWVCGRVFLPSPDDPGTLVPGTAFFEDRSGDLQLLTACDLAKRTSMESLPERVFATGEPEWICRPPGSLHGSGEPGMSAAFPLVAGREVVGVLEFHAEEPAEPDKPLLEAMERIGKHLGRVIERDRLDRAVRDGVSLIRKISDTAPTMIRLLDFDDDRYLFVNERMAKFFGTNVEDLMRSQRGLFYSAVHPDDQAIAKRAMTDVRSRTDGSVVTWQVRARDANDRWRWVRTWSVLFSPSAAGAANQILNISIDVTEEVAREEKLRQSERLSSIGTLAAGIAHEINNPLASVVMTAQLLLRRGVDPAVGEMLENIIEDAKRCGRIVSYVQRFARQEQFDRRPMDLNEIVKSAVQAGRAALRRADLHVQLELAEGLPPVCGDAGGLEQVVLSLITNAAHASKPGEDLRIRTDQENGHVRLKVIDRGKGMSPDVQRRAFDPFFTTRGREGGTGLGLSSAHGIINEHDGTIELESAVGRGTTVTVCLPAQMEADG